MSKIVDIFVAFPGVVIVHQKIPSQEVEGHRHGDHEFFLPLQGEISVISGNETVKAGPGRMLYVPPNREHRFSSSKKGSGERVIWLIDQKLWRKHVQDDFAPCSLPLNSLAKEIIFYLLIHREAKGVPFFVAALVESLADSLRSFQLEKARIFSEHISGKIKDERILKLLQIMEEELASISLTEMARRSGMSLRSMNRVFLKECGLSPKDYLILRKMGRAKKLLRGTKMTVTDISMEVGYNSLSKFIGTFKKVTGTLPSDYRMYGGV